VPIPDKVTLDNQQQFVSETSIFREPYHQYSANELLNYYRNRKTVQFFPVCEADQVTDDFIEKVLKNEFEFNHESHVLKQPIDWFCNPTDDIEWLIMLHKGYYLVGLMKLFNETKNNEYLQKWIELTDSWIGQVNDPGFIATDVTGRRIQNWIYAFYFLINQKSKLTIGNDFLLRFFASLEKQVNHLINHLTPARNHRTLELYAVFLAAVVFPEFKRANQWLEYSLQALADNADTDILADGVHCELSTFYHHIVLKNLLSIKRLAIINQISMPARFDAAVSRALDFSLFVHKPDGQIPSLSDGDSGCFYDLLQQGYEFYDNEQSRFVFSQGNAGTPPSENSKAFSDSGYYILRSAWNDASESFQDARYLVFDCGPLGVGNHGHLDLLNIEMYAYGRSLIVDPGRYTYDESGEINWRVLFRSTRYHNTVEVNGKNQTKYSYSKRKGKYKILGIHAKPKLISFINKNQCHFLHGMALSQEYSAIHERKIFFINEEYWLISDVLCDKQINQYALRYHLCPEAENRTFITQHNNVIAIRSPGLLMMQASNNETEVSLETGFISQHYGEKQQAPIINFLRNTDNTIFDTMLFPCKQEFLDVVWETLDTRITRQEIDPESTSTFCLNIKTETGTGTIKDLFFIAHDGQPRQWQYGCFICTGYLCYIRLNEDGILVNYFTGPDSFIHFNNHYK